MKIVLMFSTIVTVESPEAGEKLYKEAKAAILCEIPTAIVSGQLSMSLEKCCKEVKQNDEISGVSKIS